ncbi:unnamed protein product [Amoebophrya sp. A25]|nr:unnamed protein product [Amoebophrya sp. A25]|eukprot:GSA25T00016755001.1
MGFPCMTWRVRSLGRLVVVNRYPWLPLVWRLPIDTSTRPLLLPAWSFGGGTPWAEASWKISI